MHEWAIITLAIIVALTITACFGLWCISKYGKPDKVKEID